MARKKAAITIIGTGLSRDDISCRALRIIEQADVLVGGRRQLDFFPEYTGTRVAIDRQAEKTVRQLTKKLSGKRAAVLASGDPNFFGIASLFYRFFEKELLEVIPNASAFQWAFARIGQPWNEAVCISIHGRAMAALDRVVTSNGTFVVYCDGANTPAAAASYLMDKVRELGACRTWVFEDLGGARERIRSGKLQQFAGRRASVLSMMIIERRDALTPPALGVPDELFLHKRGMITKRDVRIMVLSRLNLHSASVMWDIGAGSGSVAIEAARLAPHLRVYAIEERLDRLEELKKNIRQFAAPAVEPVSGSAPGACRGLPAPDTVFVGGSGGRLESVMATLGRRMAEGGHLVVACVTIPTLAG
ncbi:precorrin-6y C5,15-methyltransferase (decarboxylating) subunit CbiE, partial [Thermodesulfobacteriota bacterium]